MEFQEENPFTTYATEPPKAAPVKGSRKPRLDSTAPSKVLVRMPKAVKAMLEDLTEKESRTNSKASFSKTVCRLIQNEYIRLTSGVPNL